MAHMEGLKVTTLAFLCLMKETSLAFLCQMITRHGGSLPCGSFSMLSLQLITVLASAWARELVYERDGPGYSQTVHTRIQMVAGALESIVHHEIQSPALSAVACSHCAALVAAGFIH